MVTEKSILCYIIGKSNKALKMSPAQADNYTLAILVEEFANDVHCRLNFKRLGTNILFFTPRTNF